MEIIPEPNNTSKLLHFLLFIDERRNILSCNREILDYFQSLQRQYHFKLQVIDVSQQVELAEFFKIVVTPTLIKISPEPRQKLTGTNLIEQLDNWWISWRNQAMMINQKTAENNLKSESSDFVSKDYVEEAIDSLDTVKRFLSLNDQIFKLKQQKEALIAQVKFKDQVIAMLAHDLRNPLTAVYLALETIEINSNQEDYRSNFLSAELVSKLIKQSREQLKYIQYLITDILESNRQDNSLVDQISMQKIDLGAIIRNVIKQLNSKLQLKSQQIKTDIPQDIPMIYGDSEQIRQVIVNLLDNAIKYSPEETEISVSILHRTTQKIQVTICDRGLGIPPEYQQDIFQDKFRLTWEGKEDGYGLGLSLCQRIIRAHYGHIWVESTIGKGSSFHFTLPIY